MEIIDFHTHPYLTNDDNICIYKNEAMPEGEIRDYTLSDLRRIGINRFAGSVISRCGEGFEPIRRSNEIARKMCTISGGTYIPGIQLHPTYLEDSIREIDKAKTGGVKLIGELVPYFYGWDYDKEGFEEILDYTDKLDFVYSMHSTNILLMQEIAKRHKNTNFVFAHPGEADRLKLHIETMKECDNVYLDLSGTGLFRYGMLKHLVNEVGAERILFGSDYPICNPAMYIGGVLYERLRESEFELIMAGNAKRLLNLD